jgi:hypothetical protein
MKNKLGASDTAACACRTALASCASPRNNLADDGVLNPGAREIIRERAVVVCRLKVPL